MDSLWSFFGRGGYLPQGDCLAWSGQLLWTLAGANAITALAFFSIPLAIASFLRRRPTTSVRPYALLFGAFVFAVGLTRAIDVLTLWRPDYGLEALTQVATAAISTAAAIAVWALLPRAVRIPSVQELRSVIGSLEAEIRRRRSAEESLQETQQSLAATLACCSRQSERSA